MSDKKIFVSGKEINYSNMDDEKILKLYNQLIERQAALMEKAQKYIESEKINDIDINNVNV